MIVNNSEGLDMKFDGIKKNRAFTLIELLVVIAIIALLLSILVPSLQKVREAAKKVVCLSNQHSISLAMITYSTANNGRLLKRYDVDPIEDREIDKKNSLPYSWPDKGCVDIMAPYIGLMEAADCPSSKFKSEYIDPAEVPSGYYHAGDWIVNFFG